MTAFTVFIIILLLVIGPSLFVVIGKQRERAIPKRPSAALPLAEDATTLDRHWQSIKNGWNEKNALCLLHSNLDAFAVRVAAARAAGRSLDLMYYMWNADLTGRLMMREVIAAADRGVRVRLLLDDLGVSISDRIFHAIDSHPNIELRLFNPTRARENILHRSIELVLRFRSVNRRMHNKAWIADGRAVIVGGRNIGDAYFDAAERANFHDFDILGFGNIVADATAIFDDYWNSAVAVPVRSLLARRPNKLARLRRELDALPKSEAAKPYLERVESQHGRDHFLMSDRLHWVESVDVLADPPEKAAGKRRKGHNFLMESLLPLMQEAGDSLHITSPYFIPGKQGVGIFSRLAESGVSVAILTNSLAATDVAAVHAGYARYRKPLLAAGVRLHELRAQADQANFTLRGSGQASLHTKAFTRDGATGYIGSLNFDPRSASLNTEMGVVFNSAPLVARMDEIFAKEIRPSMSFALEIDKGRHIVWMTEEQGRTRTYRREPDAAISRRIVAGIMRFLPLESQL
ncbi:phospholipase D family protein [Agrobacterium sp. B1(2019)]|uniref:phospholipase D family protein n=1 Tax=Agrobacterium sp. B1(2019) TaxID=2607032 RepID=UPI0011F04852|nr:phospholipase D family protein [Agrobacterium sp. B1(2019)]TZG36944.1 phospholipase D family protein [Agrobacterium sp. B1(2019)]